MARNARTDNGLEGMAEIFLDTGCAFIGRNIDNVNYVQCPHCNVSMDNIVDTKQTHVWIASCPHLPPILIPGYSEN